MCGRESNTQKKFVRSKHIRPGVIRSWVRGGFGRVRCRRCPCRFVDGLAGIERRHKRLVHHRNLKSVCAGGWVLRFSDRLDLGGNCDCED